MTRASQTSSVFAFTAVIFIVCICAAAQAPLPERPPANVAGKWTMSTRGETGEVHTDYVTLEQNGSVLTGHFKGPFQSGSLEGSINQQHVVFRTKTRHPVTFRGRVDGDTMDGTVHVMGRAGEFHGSRSPAN